MLYYYFLRVLFLFLFVTAGAQRLPVHEHSPDSHVLSQRSSALSPAQSREKLISLLRNAYRQGWKPKLKHYTSGTRFGRQR